MAGGLLVLQLNLLGIAALHQHSDFSFATAPGPANLDKDYGHRKPAAIDWTLCPVCQIMRLSAARPATGSRAEAPESHVMRAAAVHLPAVFADPPAAIHSRAPPPA